MNRPTFSILLFLASAIISALVVFGDDTVSRLETLKKNLARQQAENRVQEDRVNRLKTELELMRSSDRHIEKVSREKLLLSRDGELLFIFDQEQ